MCTYLTRRCCYTLKKIVIYCVCFYMHWSKLHFHKPPYGREKNDADFFASKRKNQHQRQDAVLLVDVCTCPVLARGPTPASASQWEIVFPTFRPGPINEGWFFQRARKIEMSFLTVGPGYNKRKTNYIACHSGLSKERGSFQIGG